VNGQSVAHSPEYCSFVIARLYELSNQSRSRNLTDDEEEKIVDEIDDIIELNRINEGLEAGTVKPDDVFTLETDDKGNPVYVLSVGKYRGYYYESGGTFVGVKCAYEP
jgi:hypothetical protein